MTLDQQTTGQIVKFCVFCTEKLSEKMKNWGDKNVGLKIVWMSRFMLEIVTI